MAAMVDTFGSVSVPASVGNDQVQQFYQALEQIQHSGNASKLLPSLLNLGGKPYRLDDYFPFQPLFDAQVPRRMVWVTGRQVSKSTCLAARGVVYCMAVPNHVLLYVSPLFEQTRRFSANYVRPFVDNSPLRELLLDTSTTRNVLQRSFVNQSMMIFSFAAQDTERIRGVPARAVEIDEAQNINPEHLPVITETLSAAPDGGQVLLAGTPKTLDNLLHTQLRDSSWAEWVIHCRPDLGGCGFWNIACTEHHLLKMIGPYRDDISEQRPGVICAKCRRPISPRWGRWIHRYEERRVLFEGRHVPQCIMPLHYKNPDKWAELLAKQQGNGGYTTAKFYNEVLGEALDESTKLISETDLIKVSNQGPNTIEYARSRLRLYDRIVLAADWGGGGEKRTSFTSLALLGMRHGYIDVIWGKRLMTPHDHLREAKEVLYYMTVFRPTIFAHDYTGAGALRETVLVQSGQVPLGQIMPIWYVRAATRAPVLYCPPSDQHPRSHYKVDKTRTLLLTAAMIRQGRVRFFDWDGATSDDPNLIREFLALQEEKVDTKSAGDVYLIYRNEALSDDFAQAVNYGCVALWHTCRQWPNLVDPKYVLSDAQLEALAGKGEIFNEGGGLTRSRT